MGLMASILTIFEDKHSTSHNSLFCAALSTSNAAETCFTLKNKNIITITRFFKA